MPPVLRALLEAELAAGNKIVEVAHCFPAPPAGAYFKLAKPVSSRPRTSGGGIDFYDRNSSIYSGEFTDGKRFFFILEPPHPPPEPDMSATRAASAPAMTPQTAVNSPKSRRRKLQLEVASSVPESVSVAPDSPLRRFQESMKMDFDKWHDGIGYDLDALTAMSPAERAAVETSLIHSAARGWRDIEALALLKTPGAQKALRNALNDRDPEVRMAVLRYAPELVSDAKRTSALVEALGTARFFGGLSQAMDEVADFHPPRVMVALLRGALDREGDVAVHFAAMLMFVHGKAKEPFDMKQRPFFLRFNTDIRAEREAVFRELCVRIGVKPEKYLNARR